MPLLGRFAGAPARDRRGRAVVRGRVQGVGFRFFAQRAARELGVRGWVRNRPDGSVEIRGRRRRGGASREYLERLARGPAHGRASTASTSRRSRPQGFDALRDHGDDGLPRVHPRRAGFPDARESCFATSRRCSRRRTRSPRRSTAMAEPFRERARRRRSSASRRAASCSARRSRASSTSASCRRASPASCRARPSASPTGSSTARTASRSTPTPSRRGERVLDRRRRARDGRHREGGGRARRAARGRASSASAFFIELGALGRTRPAGRAAGARGADAIIRALPTIAIARNGRPKRS